MLVDQGVVAEVRNGVKVRVEGPARAENDAEVAEGGIQRASGCKMWREAYLRRLARLGTALGSVTSARHSLGGSGHHLRWPAVPPKLEGEPGGRHAQPAGIVLLSGMLVRASMPCRWQRARSAGNGNRPRGAEAPGHVFEGLAVGEGRTRGPGLLALYGRWVQEPG